MSSLIKESTQMVVMEREECMKRRRVKKITYIELLKNFVSFERVR